MCLHVSISVYISFWIEVRGREMCPPQTVPISAATVSTLLCLCFHTCQHVIIESPIDQKL